MSRQFFIDCGGHDGCSVRKFRSETDPEAEFTVHSFEPNPALHRHYEGLSNHVLHREAVWDRAGVARLRVDPFVGLNSTLSAGRFASHSALFEDDAPDPPQIQVPCLDLARWMREHLRPTDTIHLKLAVEGVEWDILKGLLRDGTLAWIDRLLLHSGSPDRPPPLTRRRLLREVGRRTAVEAWDASLYAHEHIRPRLFCTVGVDWDLGLLPHWLRHYRRAGVAPADFHVVLNTRFDDNRRVEPARRLLAAADVEASAVWRGTFSSTARLDYKTPFLDALPDDAWVLVVDSDEFHRYPLSAQGDAQLLRGDWDRRRRRPPRRSGGGRWPSRGSTAYPECVRAVSAGVRCHRDRKRRQELQDPGASRLGSLFKVSSQARAGPSDCAGSLCARAFEAPATRRH